MDHEQVEKEQLLWKRRAARRMAILSGIYAIAALIAVVFIYVKKVESDRKVEQLEIQVVQSKQESLAASARAEKAETDARQQQMLAQAQAKAAREHNAQLQAELDKCRKGRK